jgi:hypothetical protein
LDIAEVKRGITNLISGLNHDKGVSLNVWLGTLAIVEAVLGKGAADHLARLVDSVDTDWFFDDPASEQEWVTKWIPESISSGTPK